MDASLDGPTRPTLEVESSAPADLDHESKRLRNEIALLPDVTFEIGSYIAKKATVIDHKMDKKYPDLRKHLSAKINTKNTIFRYPKASRATLTWTSIKGSTNHEIKQFPGNIFVVFFYFKRNNK